MSGGSDIEVGGRRLSLSNLERPYWRSPLFTKADLLGWYRDVAPALLPHVRRRPMTLARFPEGIEAHGWYQMNCRGNPPWVAIAELPSRGGAPLRYCLLDDLPSLLWAVNQGTVELHPFLGTAEALEEPSWLVFDLDPGPCADVLDAARVALALRRLLEEDGLIAWPKTSGRLGLHLYVPLARGHTFAASRAYARALAERLEEAEPERITAKMHAPREGRVFIDWGQNHPRKSTIAAYSLRAMPVPLVSTPLRWCEVEEAQASAAPALLRFGPDAVLRRLETAGELFSPVLDTPQSLPAR